MNMSPAVRLSPGLGLANDSTGQALVAAAPAVPVVPVVVAGVAPVDGAFAAAPAAAGAAAGAAPAGQVLVTVMPCGTGVGVTRPVVFGWVPTKTGNETVVSWPVT